MINKLHESCTHTEHLAINQKGNEMKFEGYVIKSLPPSAYYIPNFISDTEEAEIIKNIYSVPKPKWTHLSNRRLQDYGGVPHKNGMFTEKIPEWLEKYVMQIKAEGIFPGDNLPNHVLVNEYKPKQGIMPHTDGPLFYPIVTTVSCASHAVLELERSEKVFRVLLEPRSLFVLKDDLYQHYLHGIRETASDVVTADIANLENCGRRYAVGETLRRNTRVSLTVRNVPKVLKFKMF